MLDMIFEPFDGVDLAYIIFLSFAAKIYEPERCKDAKVLSQSS
jgi:hypothetical protein